MSIVIMHNIIVNAPIGTNYIIAFVNCTIKYQRTLQQSYYKVSFIESQLLLLIVHASQYKLDL